MEIVVKEKHLNWAIKANKSYLSTEDYAQICPISQAIKDVQPHCKVSTSEWTTVIIDGHSYYLDDVGGHVVLMFDHEAYENLRNELPLMVTLTKTKMSQPG